MYSPDESKERRLYVKIFFSENGRSSAIVAYFRNDMTAEFFFRWKWYFEYRAALLKVKHPRSFVDYIHGSYEYVLPTDVLEKKLRSKLVGAKSYLTRYEKKLEILRSKWNELFPLEDHPDWKKVMDKLEHYQFNVMDLQSKIDKLYETQE